ncbi:MAG: GNAT family N-acetyltransferase [Oscillospiraceae bacterium]|nr:GNAT family N-acetyltransferase [Oscillospiraceae bacterium]MBR6658313.1 GNAT family N-acetyltransferase [Oscillospiraceae bacterium]
MITIRKFSEKDAKDAAAIWNRVVEDGVAFPQLESLSVKDAEKFFGEQDFTGIAFDSETGEIVGLYILHPNNIGRCGHIANASYAVKADCRGKHIGEAIVSHSLEKAKELGFKLMQFNAVVAANHPAIHIYEKLGFIRLGTIPGGFHMKDGHYEDIILFYHTL